MPGTVPRDHETILDQDGIRPRAHRGRHPVGPAQLSNRGQPITGRELPANDPPA
ncbi:hypothetical protein SFR_1629 [Streptomyces sp. FR-008]|nr:hypothetical protein SFR_1629 [Streptomyces sp. FR-008]